MKTKEKRCGKIRIIINRLCIVVFVFAILFAAVCAFKFKSALAPIHQANENTEAYFEYVTIPSGMSVKEIGSLLEEKNFVKSSTLFYYIVRFPNLILKREAPVTFKSGVYKFSTEMSMLEIINTMIEGKQAFIKTIIPEGLTIKKIAKILQDNGVCESDKFIEATKKEALLKRFDINAQTCEGFLFPDTYYLYPKMDADEVAFKMVENFFMNLNKIQGQENATTIDYEKLIIASIIEREYRVDTEAPLIASVFYNRIKTGMGLESCATIEYIITEILDKPHPDIITYADLKIDSPYNTYKWAALPPTPISNPGIVAISAALNPSESNFYYFTLVDRVAGRHTFSETLKSHIKATTEFRTKKAN